MNAESAIDLSLKSRHFSNRVLDNTAGAKQEDVPILRPTPRPPWSIIWYQNLWPTSVIHNSVVGDTLPITSPFIPQCENAFSCRSSPSLSTVSITPSLTISKRSVFFEADQPSLHATSYPATTDATTDNQLHEGDNSSAGNLPSSLTWVKSQPSQQQLYQPSITPPPSRINCITSESSTTTAKSSPSNDANDNQPRQSDHESQSTFEQRE